MSDIEDTREPREVQVCPECEGRRMVWGCDGTGAAWQEKCFTCGGKGYLTADDLRNEDREGADDR